MPRVTTVKKARKDQGSCSKCGAKIKAGDGYRWWKFRHGGVRIRCLKSGCAPKASDLTQSEIKGTLYSMQEGFVAEGDSPDDIASALRDFAEEVRNEVVEGLLQEKLDNIEQGMGHTNAPVYEELSSRKDELEAWCDEMESTADEIEGEEFEEETDEEPDAEGKDPEDAEEDKARRREEWLEELRDKARDAVGSCPE